MAFTIMLLSKVIYIISYNKKQSFFNTGYIKSVVNQAYEAGDVYSTQHQQVYAGIVSFRAVHGRVHCHEAANHHYLHVLSGG